MSAALACLLCLAPPPDVGTDRQPIIDFATLTPAIAAQLAGQRVDEVMVVEAVLRVVRHPTAVHDGVRFEGFAEWRLTEARQVE
jgi:hypothetical protein